ncbi:uncharacterized protein A4U43_C07F27030 [Asparagus officinalis]|uniref:Uncharacterized protein n=1 Tax=Asparagus officinalis TaxID=4686 RepID=A0A5P1EH51_ASPOF|nr:uncharacterized protein A4U43_C07F27030 [Asparagus officinalis]
MVCAVSKALFRAHVEGQLKSEIMANSDYHYTNKMMHYAFNRGQSDRLQMGRGARGEFTTGAWRSLRCCSMRTPLAIGRGSSIFGADSAGDREPYNVEGGELAVMVRMPANSGEVAAGIAGRRDAREEGAGARD